MKKTKVICSVGPACNNVKTMTEMVNVGMNCARINLSHATYDDILDTIEVVRKVRSDTKMPVAIMYDTKGPEFRSGMLENDKITFSAKLTKIFYITSFTLKKYILAKKREKLFEGKLIV